MPSSPPPPAPAVMVAAAVLDHELGSEPLALAVTEPSEKLSPTVKVTVTLPLESVTSHDIHAPVR